MTSTAELAAAVADVQRWLQEHEQRHAALEGNLSTLQGAIETVRTGAQALESVVGTAAATSAQSDLSIAQRQQIKSNKCISVLGVKRPMLFDALRARSDE